MPWWANFAWCGVFGALLFGPLKPGLILGCVGVLLRIYVVAGTFGTLWMLSGLGWFSVMAFYALTVWWPVMLWLLWKRSSKVPTLATAMIPLAALEGAGPLITIAGMLTAAMLGSPRFELQSASAALLAIFQIFFLMQKMRTA